MSEIVGDEPCEECQKTGHDGQGNHKMIFADGGKYCPKAEYHESGEPYYEPANNPANVEEIEEELDVHWTKYTPQQIKSTLPYGAIPERKLSEETINHFGLRVEYDTSTGEVDKVFYPYFDGKELGYKLRKHFEEGDREVKNKPELIGKFKCFRAVGNVKGSLFNQHKVPRGSKKVLLVEGEEDAPAAYEMLKKYNPKVLSIPSGATINKDGKGVLDKAIIENLDYLQSHKELVVCFDQDKAGKAITEELSRLIGPSVKVMHISKKDASDALTKGGAEEFVSAYFDADTLRPHELLTLADMREAATEVPVYGRPWPWSTLTKLTYGRRGGEGIYVGAGAKVGKTEFLTTMIDHVTRTEGFPIFGAKFEQSESLTLQTIAGKRDKVAWHNPDTYIEGGKTKEDLEKAIDDIGDSVYLFNAGYSDAGEGDLWERIKGVIRYVVLTKGVKDVFIDPITQLTDGMTSSETETYLRKFSNELQALAQELDFFYYIFVHLKAPDTGKPHEEGGRVKAAQFRGSRAMAEKTKLMLGIERDTQASDEEERNTSTFRLLLNSGFGKPGVFPVVYNPITTEYKEPKMSIGGSNGY